MTSFGFHPLIARWFLGRFSAPTEPQRLGWPLIAAREHTLIAAPTGSGKTLTAFLAVVDRLLQESIAGQLTDGTRVVYVSPLRALSNDMHRNLSVPLEELNSLATDEFPDVPISLLRVGLRTGDSTASERAALVRRPPHIIVTTPESLYLLLTSHRGRDALKTVDTVIVDEIHALVRDKRGSHLALSLERLEALCQRRIQRIGLSATQKPIERIAEFLVGVRYGELPISDGQRLNADATHSALPRIIDVGHSRELDLQIEIPPSELSAVCSHEQWAEVNARLVELINTHRSTLIFVNTRRLAERLTHQLSELLGEDQVGSHHGSLASELRLKTEQRLKSGDLKAVVATASLELGLDVGYIDLVVQIGSPRSIATFLQRIGRSGHSLGKTPKGRLFALTRDELIECMALIRAIRSGRLDVVPIPEAPLDVLIQQIVGEVACEEWSTDELIALCRRAWPYRNLSREHFEAALQILSDGLTDRSGRDRLYVHYDRVQRRIRSRPGARIAATSNAGAIPEVAQFRVVAQPESTVVGTLDEDFATESHAGQIFLLGNTSWRIEGVRGTDVLVTDAHGAPPTIPFWRGEAPGRTFELSDEVSRLREELEARVRGISQSSVAGSDSALSTQYELLSTEQTELTTPQSLPSHQLSTSSGQQFLLNTQYSERSTPQSVLSPEHSVLSTQGAKINSQSPPAAADTPVVITAPSSVDSDTTIAWLLSETRCSEFAARQTVNYIAAQLAAVGVVPNQKRIVFERFFDETGGMQMVVHAPFGSRVTHAWGLAMRKRFCVSFDFELQATADDDGFILSLGPQHSFPLESMFPMLNRQNVRALLEQAVLRIPMFQIRWRWNANRALLVLRRDKGQKIPPNLQRFRADDLLTSVFPQLTGCQENVVGDLKLPDHPLLRQTMDDCLSEPLDLQGLMDVLGRIEAGEIELVARDTREPSPFSYELLNSNPYAFLDGGEIAERRARAVATRRSLTIESVGDLSRLDPAAIEQVCCEARPLVRNADELHDVLLTRIILPVGEGAEFRAWFDELCRQHRATRFQLSSTEAWCAAERLPAVCAMFPGIELKPTIEPPDGVRTDWTDIDARIATLRGLIEVSGPITHLEAAERTGMTPQQAFASLEALEGEGVVLRGRFREAARVSVASAPNSSSSNAVSGPSEIANLALSRLSIGAAGDQPHDRPVEWCHRRLLARIHRITMQGLRREIEPVSAETYLRFLTHHHGLVPAHHRAGANGLFEVIAMLQGQDLPAVAWEREILPGRLIGYQPEWLDELCLTGEVGWGRLYPPHRDAGRSVTPANLTRVAPVSIFLRQDLAWLTPSTLPDQHAPLSPQAESVRALLAQRGALFGADLRSQIGCGPAELDEVLGELICRGLLTADGFAGLRQFLASRNGVTRPTPARLGWTRQRMATTGTGRWSLWRDLPSTSSSNEVPRALDAVRQPDGPASSPAIDPLEQWAWQLLRRWGVVFRDVLEREDGSPPWWQLLQVFRRWEARGEIRGGRFVTGVAGEQYALPDTIQRLRQLRNHDSGNTKPHRTLGLRQSFLSPGNPAETSENPDNPVDDELVVISAVDPLNLVGIITSDERVPRLAANRVVLWNGAPVAAVVSRRFVRLRRISAAVWDTVAARLGKSRTEIDVSDEVVEATV